jgi:hypothetical protein
MANKNILTVQKKIAPDSFLFRLSSFAAATAKPAAPDFSGADDDDDGWRREEEVAVVAGRRECEEPSFVCVNVWNS